MTLYITMQQEIGLNCLMLIELSVFGIKVSIYGIVYALIIEEVFHILDEFLTN